MAEQTTVSISKTELWVIRAVGAALLAVLGWIGAQAQGAVIQLAQIKRELEITRPADILQAVRDLERISLTKDEVRAIMTKEAPWTEERLDWHNWRAEVNRKLDRMEADN